MIWSQDSISCHKATSVVLGPSMSPKSLRLHSSLCLAELFLSLVRAHLGLGTKGWCVCVFPGGGRGAPAGPSLSRRATGRVCCVFWGALRGRCTPGACVMVSAVPFSIWECQQAAGLKVSEGFCELNCWILVNWIAFRCKRNVVCAASSWWRSLKQLQIMWVWAASPHTLESLLTKISWILLI